MEAAFSPQQMPDLIELANALVKTGRIWDPKGLDNERCPMATINPLNGPDMNAGTGNK